MRISRWCVLWHILFCCYYNICACICLLLAFFGYCSEVEFVLIVPVSDKKDDLSSR